MRPTPKTLKLPAKLVDEIGEYDGFSRRRKPHRILSSRKDRRNADRVQKKAQRNEPLPVKRQRLNNVDRRDGRNFTFRAGDHLLGTSHPREPTIDGKMKPKSDLNISKLPKEPPKEIVRTMPSPLGPEKLPRSVTTKLEQDDAEIALLEKKLGIKNKKKLPQAFRDDGLDGLLEGLDTNSGESLHPDNSNQASRDWLAKKRSYAHFGLDLERKGRDEASSNRKAEQIASGTSSDGESFRGCEEEEEEEEAELNASFYDGIVTVKDSFERFSSEPKTIFPFIPAPRRKENPYVAPTSREGQVSIKYVPPSLRNPPSNSESLTRLRRQVQGLINRLTEANLLSILGDVEKLYRENARQYVTSTLVDLLLISVCEPTILPDTFIILPAGFITAVYRVIGTDFGAQVIERVVELFHKHYNKAIKAARNRPVLEAFESSKETSNLMTLIAELYNFQVVGCNLIFDYVRVFLQTLSELNAELLLRIIRVSGPQLRQDDPSSLRDIVTMLGSAVADIGEQNLSIRMKFMIESINDLKNNRLKTGTAATSVISEHTVRMNKIIGSLKTRRVKACEPLRIGLKDIQDSDKSGKWWLVGASWGRNESSRETNGPLTSLMRKACEYDSMGTETGSTDLVQLAREQRMNTDIRKAIFVTVMSASDYQDAYLRLMKLKLKRVQELEIPKVIIHCSGAEKHYNPYYTLIAKKLCCKRKLKMAFHFNLWDLFKRMGEANENDEAGEDNGDEGVLEIRQIVNLAKMYGALIIEGGIGLDVLKNLNLSCLQVTTKMFIEILFVTVLLQTQLQSESGRDEGTVMRIFSKVKDTPSMIRGLQYFLKKVLVKTDLAGGETELATVRWACKVAARFLDSLLTAETAKA